MDSRQAVQERGAVQRNLTNTGISSRVSLETVELPCSCGRGIGVAYMSGNRVGLRAPCRACAFAKEQEEADRLAAQVAERNRVELASRQANMDKYLEEL